MSSVNRIRAAVVRGPGRIECADIELAEPQASQAVISIEACGICGSDLHMLGSDSVPVGLTPGHEMCGRVERVGADVTNVSEGSRVVVEPTAACGACAYCTAGDPQLCPELAIYGVHMAGGLAEKLVVRADCLHAIDDTLAPEVAALAEPVAVALHAMRRARLESGNRVLVQGAGTIGLVTTLVATAMGAEVWQSARYEHQGRMAQSLGARRVLREGKPDSLELSKLARRTDFDIVAETVGGRASTLEDACHAVRPGGTIVVLGMFLESPTIAPLSLLVKEATMLWSNCYARRGGSGDFADAARIVEQQRGSVALLATHQFKLSEVGKAFAAATDRRSGAVKISVLP